MPIFYFNVGAKPIGVKLRICFLGFWCLEIGIRISKSKTNQKFQCFKRILSPDAIGRCESLGL
jgi:hypothetical protein